MDVAGILEKMFRLPEDFAVPNILYAEELSEDHPELPVLGLTVLDVHAKYITEAYELGDKYAKTSTNDLLALVLAKQEDCPLLTGDAKLREAAEDQLVEVRGTLWVVERMYEEKIISCVGIEAAYEKMKEEGRRLPWVEVNKQINRFKKK